MYACFNSFQLPISIVNSLLSLSLSLHYTIPTETVMPVLSTLACALIDCENDVTTGSGELTGVMSADGDEDSLTLERDGHSIIMQVHID